MLFCIKIYRDKTSCPLVTGFEEVIVRCSLVPSNLFGMERLHSYTAIITFLRIRALQTITCAEDCVSSG